MEWESWNSLPFTDRDRLPPGSGIYVVVDSSAQVWYVGKSSNLNSRWKGKGHHRYRQLNRSNNQRLYKIYWQLFPLHLLSEKEELYIKLFKPHLNYTRVKKFAQRAIQPEREIGRILKILNKKTMLFPNLRSVILGYYRELDEDENGMIKEYTSVVVGVSLNDIVGIISNSYNKSLTKRGTNLKGSWGIYESYCGQNDNELKPAEIIVFILENVVYEFISCYDLISRLEREKLMLYHIKLQEQITIALKDPSIISSLNTPNDYLITRDEDYLRYRVQDLRPISELFDRGDFT